MTNREWLMEQMQNMSDDELTEFLYRGKSACALINPCAVDIQGKDEEEITCEECMCTWLSQEHKENPKLTEVEKVILANIDKEYKWICKNLSGDVWFYTEKPIKDECVWGYNPNDMRQKSNRSDFPNLFQFIKWEDKEPYEIVELLKGE